MNIAVISSASAPGLLESGQARDRELDGLSMQHAAAWRLSPLHKPQAGSSFL